MKIFVDIDGTVCTQEKDYRDARPIPENIAKINKLFDNGNIITYWTARGQTSKTNWKIFTLDQLNKWGCKYHYISFNKPSFDLLIDDRTKRIEEL